jgi:CTP:molybdopterin cytidylyltransferase MocA
MGSRNKLLVNVGGRPLVAAAVEGAIASGLTPMVVVAGHLSDPVSPALSGLPIQNRRELALS